MTTAVLRPFCEPLVALAAEVGPCDPVVPAGGRTQWEIGGLPDPGAREIFLPKGVLEYEPAEMTVRCLAGTTLAELAAVLAEAGQMVPLDLPHADVATVGGVLAVGRSGIKRLGYGPIRDVLLQVVFVTADGELVRSGGPTVKNVSGFDLCRLMVGSLGTLGVIGEVILRCFPRPAVSQWFSGEADPFELLHRLYRPVSILWDGSRVWLCLEGHPADVAAQASLTSLEPCDGPPELPSPGRASMRPSELKSLEGEFVAEVGVGVVHLLSSTPTGATGATGAWEARNLALCQEIKQRFDPLKRLNPGRSVWAEL